VRWGWLPTNPVSLASPPRLASSNISPPSPAVVQALVATAEKIDPALATYVQLAAATGARRGELVALRWSSVDLDTGVIRITRGIVHGLDGLAEKDTKSHAGRRIAIDPGTVTALRRHRSRVDEGASACGVALNKEAPAHLRRVEGGLYPDRARAVSA